MRAGNPVSTSADYPDISIPLIRSKELARLSTSTAVLVDIRPSAHYKKGHIENYLHELLSHEHSSPEALKLCDEIRSSYKLTKDIGLRWVQSTIEENWDIEPQLAAGSAF